MDHSTCPMASHFLAMRRLTFRLSCALRALRCTKGFMQRSSVIAQLLPFIKNPLQIPCRIGTRFDHSSQPRAAGQSVFLWNTAASHSLQPLKYLPALFRPAYEYASQ